MIIIEATKGRFKQPDQAKLCELIVTGVINVNTCRYINGFKTDNFKVLFGEESLRRFDYVLGKNSVLFIKKTSYHKNGWEVKMLAYL